MGIPPLPSTTSSLINNPFPIDDPLSHQQPHPSLTTPLLSMTPINDLIPHQLPLSHQRSHPLSTTPSAIDDLVSYQQPLLPSTSSGINNLFYLSITSSPT